MATIQRNNIEEVDEAQLMPSLKESRKQTIGCNKQSFTDNNDKLPRKMSSKAGKTNEIERESEKLAADGDLTNMGLNQKPKAQNSGEKEEGVEDRPESTHLKPNKQN